jgi:nucleoid DNA-binding protein
MKPLSQEQFFKMVAVNAGSTDVDTVKQVYYGMIKTISRELKEKKRVKLPDWGEFYIQLYKERNFKPINADKVVKLGPRPAVKFDPDYKVKDYFKTILRQDSGII